MSKICTKCKIEKSISEYYKHKGGKYGIKGRCKLCKKDEYEKNKEIIIKKQKEYYEKNKEKNKEKNREMRNRKAREYYKNNQEKNREMRNRKAREYYHKNIDKIKKNRETQEYKENRNKNIKERRKNDLQYKTMNNIRSRLSEFLKERTIKKNNTTILSVGCSKKHLTDWIKYNIDLDDLNEYHIDHVRPLASFNCKTYEEVIETKCNHWTNLIPTSPEYNLIKSDREPTKHELFKQELRIYLFKKNN